MPPRRRRRTLIRKRSTWPLTIDLLYSLAPATAVMVRWPFLSLSLFPCLSFFLPLFAKQETRKDCVFPVKTTGVNCMQSLRKVLFENVTSNQRCSTSRWIRGFLTGFVYKMTLELLNQFCMLKIIFGGKRLVLICLNFDWNGNVKRGGF